MNTRCLSLHRHVRSQCLSTEGITFPRHTRVSCLLHHDWLQTKCDVTKSCSHVHVLNSDLRWAQRNFPASADECENSLRVSNSAHASFCTVKLKHPGEVTISETHFWVEEDFTVFTVSVWCWFSYVWGCGLWCCIRFHCTGRCCFYACWINYKSYE